MTKLWLFKFHGKEEITIENAVTPADFFGQLFDSSMLAQIVNFSNARSNAICNGLAAIAKKKRAKPP